MSGHSKASKVMKPLIAAVCIGLALAFVTEVGPIAEVLPVSTYSDSDGA